MAKITKIEQQKKNKDRYSIYIDGEYRFGVYEDVLVRYQLAKGMELEENLIEEVLKKEEQEKANYYAIGLLNFKLRTEKEIRDRMWKKEYSKEIIDSTVEFLKRLKYLDDEEYAKRFIKDRVNLKKLGKQRIKSELYYKGIDNNIINNQLDELIDHNDQYDTAMELAKKKLSTTYKNDDKNARYRKLGGFLQRRGYSMDIVMKVLREVL